MNASPRRRRVVEAPQARKAPELRSIRVVFETDSDPDASYLDQDEFGDRRKEFKRGDFVLVFARAEAEVVIEGVEQTLTSGGLGGIESDSEREYIEEIASEEWKSLREVLKAVGVATSELPLELDVEWIDWRI